LWRDLSKRAPDWFTVWSVAASLVLHLGSLATILISARSAPQRAATVRNPCEKPCTITYLRPTRRAANTTIQPHTNTIYGSQDKARPERPSAEGAQEVVSSWEFQRDDVPPQQLPLVLGARKGQLAFGRADEVGTYRVVLSGDNWQTKETKQDAESIKDTGYFDVLLTEAERWDFIREAGRHCPECRDLPVVWALFPMEFKEAIMQRLAAQAKAHPRASGGVRVQFDSHEASGFSIVYAKEARQ
jgi:hypothetical protein